jgi:hypothetical protein
MKLLSVMLLPIDLQLQENQTKHRIRQSAAVASWSR